uniref:Uncharacterized protein n=1 Tax=Peronospora matthiolae TaxID=2874970 RepID=A0AAV1U548_9STRA
MSPVDVVKLVLAPSEYMDSSGMILLSQYFAYLTPDPTMKMRIWRELNQKELSDPGMIEEMQKAEAEAGKLLEKALTSLYDALKVSCGVPVLEKILDLHGKSTDDGLRHVV